MSDPKKKVFSLLDEFKQFALKGNVIDLAVGVVIGAAFAKIVDSLVKNIVMPLVGIITPDQSYKDWAIQVGGSKIAVGEFLGDIINFLIVAMALYLFIVKFLGWVMRARKLEAAAPAPLSKDQELLTEIRDLLRPKQMERTTP